MYNIQIALKEKQYCYYYCYTMINYFTIITTIFNIITIIIIDMTLYSIMKRALMPPKLHIVSKAYTLYENYAVLK